MTHKILITCPPMIGQMHEFEGIFKAKNVEFFIPEFTQTVSEDVLMQLLPHYDGWIIGDDPATARVLQAGREGKLKAVVKWGIGVDNVDFEACKRLGLPVSNTPQMFGNEVADLAVSYLIALARQTFLIDRSVRQQQWIKPAGISLQGKTAALIGFGDIGSTIGKRLLAFDMHLQVYDPFPKHKERFSQIAFMDFPQHLEDADFVVASCALTPQTKHIIRAETIAQMKDGVRIVNVSRGHIINETDLIAGLQSGKIHSAALDVFDTEPLPADSPLHHFERCIFGSHNASNTTDAVKRASLKAIDVLFEFLGVI